MIDGVKSDEMSGVVKSIARRHNDVVNNFSNAERLS